MQYEADLVRATGGDEIKDDFISKLKRVVQLTGDFPRSSSFGAAADHPLLLYRILGSRVRRGLRERSSVRHPARFGSFRSLRHSERIR